VAVNTLNKQPRTADKGELGEELTIPQRKNSLLLNVKEGLGIGWRKQWWDFVNMAMNFHFLLAAGNFLNS
jgi:hypothetical protein